MRVKKLMMTICIVGGFLGFFAKNTAAEGINYSVKAIIPENQIDASKSYFDLKMTQGQEQDLSMTLKNTSKESITVNVTPTTATTNQNGVIDYSVRDAKKDSSLVHPFTSLVDKEQKVTLEADESKDVTFKLTMPKESFDGIILGGFSIAEDTTADKNEKSSEGVQIKNEYSFVIGVSLTETEATVVPELVLNDVNPTLLNYRTAVTLNLQNTKATIINDLKVDASISKKGSSEVLHKETKEGLSMAPNSNFEYPISWSNEALKAGDYEVSVKASVGEKNWAFKKAFTISADESKKLNEEAVEVKQEANYFWWIVSFIVVGIVGLIAIVLYVLYKKKKEKERKQAEARLKAKRKRMKKKKMENERKIVEPQKRSKKRS